MQAFKKYCTVLLLVLVLTTQTISADQSQSGTIIKDNDSYELPSENRYSLHKDSLSKNVYAGETIIKELDLQLNYKDNNVIEITAPQTGSYYVAFNYTVDNENTLPTSLSLLVNGNQDYSELGNLIFESKWARADEKRIDRYGNEIVPSINKLAEAQRKYIQDGSYRQMEPLLVPLLEGKNSLDLTIIEGDILIHSIELVGSKDMEFNDISKDLSEEASGNQIITIEAETPNLQNESSIRPASSFNNNLFPYDVKNKVLNYLDGSSFKKAGQRVNYDFEVSETGYYTLDFRYLQDSKADFVVYTNIYIDGSIPSESFKDFSFSYNNKFSDTSVVDNENNKVVVYLEKGKHTLAIQITQDAIKSMIERTEDVMRDVQSLALQITNLVGSNPDKNRDVDLNDYIPNIEDLLISWADELDAISTEMKELVNTKKNIASLAQLKIAEAQLRSIASEPRKIHYRVNELSKGTNSIASALGTLLQEINNNALSIDRIFFKQDSAKLPKKAGIFAKAWDSIKRFGNSFTDEDYSVSNVNEENLQVWVNRPRQYIEILQTMIDETFTQETGIKVDLSIMPDQNKLILANASNTAPDVAMGINYALPFDLAIRGTLKDLNEFSDFGEVSSAFANQLHVPAMIGDSVYAMPETMNFYVMFYRNDILKSIAMDVPNVMDDVVNDLPKLHQRGLNFFYPTAGMAAMKIFAGTMPIVYQNGGNFYGETINRTGFDTEESIAGFQKLTDLFTIYNMPYDVPSFYQQFRDGSIPIGISDYGSYNLILNAAPEIANLWSVAPMPGYMDENGVVQRTSSGGAESTVMFSSTDKEQESWEFMKWWASKDTQVAFGTNLQTSYGEEYIWNTANLKAFAELPWVSAHKEVILDQSEWIDEVPRVLGTYMLEREVSNAFNSVVLDGVNLRKAIDLSTKRINRETKRKLEEFGFMKDNDILKEYYVPIFESEED